MNSHQLAYRVIGVTHACLSVAAFLSGADMLVGILELVNALAYAYLWRGLDNDEKMVARRRACDPNDVKDEES